MINSKPRLSTNIKFSVQYPMLNKYVSPMEIPALPARNRLGEIRMIDAHLHNPEYSNVILLGDAGSGKTATVEEMARLDKNKQHVYVEVDLSKMSSSDGLKTGSGVDEMGTRLKNLFKEVAAWQRVYDKTLILFMDEFHIIVDPGKSGESSASQAIKPILARSGENHIKIIAATTYKEYHDYILPDEALNERLRPVKIHAPTRDVTIHILRDIKNRYAPHAYISPGLLSHIVDVTDKYIIAESQPRKSVTIFDDMLGWHLDYANNPHIHSNLDEQLLNFMMLETRGIRTDWRINVGNIEQYLNTQVLSQQLASHTLTQRLYLSVAGLVDDTRPQGSFLFTGPTGVGKTQMAKSLAKALFGSSRNMIRFNMSEFSKASSVDEFQYRLTEREANHPNSIILLDEFEKADVHISRLLLQVLDDAQLTNEYGRQVSFADSYIIMTTNAVKNVYRKMAVWSPDTTDNSLRMAHYRDLIRQDLENYPSFPSELLGRLDDFIPFTHLTAKTLHIIAKIKLNKFVNLVWQKHHARLHIDPDVQKLLVDEHMSRDTEAGGGRLLMRKINRDVEEPVAQYICICMAKREHIENIAVVQNGNLSLNNKFDRIGNGFVTVGQYASNKPLTREQIRKQREGR